MYWFRFQESAKLKCEAEFIIMDSLRPKVICRANSLMTTGVLSEIGFRRNCASAET